MNFPLSDTLFPSCSAPNTPRLHDMILRLREARGADMLDPVEGPLTWVACDNIARHVHRAIETLESYLYDARNEHSDFEAFAHYAAEIAVLKEMALCAERLRDDNPQAAPDSFL